MMPTVAAIAEKEPPAVGRYAETHAAAAERLGRQWARELCRAVRLETSAALRRDVGRRCYLRDRAAGHRERAERFRRRHEAALLKLADVGMGEWAQAICRESYTGALVLPAIAEARVRARYNASRMDLLSFAEAARLTA